MATAMSSGAPDREKARRAPRPTPQRALNCATPARVWPRVAVEQLRRRVPPQALTLGSDATASASTARRHIGYRSGATDLCGLERYLASWLPGAGSARVRLAHYRKLLRAASAGGALVLRRKKQPGILEPEAAICITEFRPGHVAPPIARWQQLPLDHPTVRAFPEFFRGLIRLEQEVNRGR
jgi:hypothetical protein